METPSAKARILIIRLSSIGDIVLTTPVVRRLHEQLDGGAEIHYLTKKKFASLLEANPYIHRVHTMEKTVQEPLAELEKIEFDYIIDLHRNIRSAVVKRRLKSLSFTFQKLNWQKWLLVRFGINRMPDVHVVDRYLDTIKGFGTADDGKGLDYFIPESTRSLHEMAPSLHQQGFVAFAIGGMHIGKRMSAEKWRRVAEHIPYPIVLLGGKEDIADGKMISAGLSHVHDFSGQLTLHESAVLLRDSKLVLSGDTGLMHIASAFNKPILSLWGCTSPVLGMSPYRPHPSSIIFEPAGRTKRPCSKLGNRCKYGEGEHRCIEHIDETALIQSALEIWQKV